MEDHERRFWRENDEYHDLAQRVEENIEITHPDVVSGRSGCGFCHHCAWTATKVKYREYRGEKIT